MRTAVSLAAVCLALACLSACARRGRPTEAPGVQATRWGYVGGKDVARADAEVGNTRDKAIYLTERYGLTAYRIAVANGTYGVKLRFAETYEKIEDVGQRVFSVAIEGKPALTDFDVFKEAGKQRLTAVAKEFAVEVRDGELTIEFAAKVQNAMINGIEVAAKGQAAALLINCGATADYEAKDGRVWRKDQEYQEAR